MRKIAVAAVRGVLAYTWYKVTKAMKGVELRGKKMDILPGTIIGLRKSADGKSTRMVIGRDNMGMVYTPIRLQLVVLLKRMQPLVGGPIDNAKVGHIETPKVGVKNGRITRELEILGRILGQGAHAYGPDSVIEIKAKKDSLMFKFNNRQFKIVPVTSGE
jgi:hypothetical protein